MGVCCYQYNIIMPIPKPGKEEKQKQFTNRCMGNGEMIKDFPDQKQRFAVCMNSWIETKKGGVMEKDIIKNDAVTVNSKGKNFANSLISAGKISQDDWSFSASDGNKILGPDNDDWANYEKHHLAIETDAEPETKARYKFPFAKNGQIYRRGVIAAKSRATQQGYNNITSAADSLLQKINKKLEIDEDSGHEMKKKKDSVQRYDFVEINIPDEDNDDILTSKFKITDEGYLTGRAIVTNIGVFPYLTADGTVRRELRPPEEVLKMESLNTLKMKPFTNNHPSDGIVDTQNIKNLQTGHLGDDIIYDNYHVSVPITITDEQTINDALNGKRAVSAGYRADLEEKSGVWLGVHYDAIQRNIKYNHVSLVDRGRAGDKAKIRFDSVDGVAFSTELQKTKKNMEDEMDLKSIKLDGVEYKAEAKVLETLNQQTNRVVDLEEKIKKIKTDAAKLEADRDTYKDTIAKLEKEKEERLDEKAINEAVERRLLILSAAKKAEVEVKMDSKNLSEAEIQRAVILKVFPKANLDGKSQDYIDARFDGAVETMEENNDSEKRKINSFVIDNFERNDDGEIKTDSDIAREKMIADMKAISRGEEVR